MQNAEGGNKKLNVELVILVLLFGIFCSLILVYIGKKRSTSLSNKLQPVTSINAAPLPTGTHIFTVSYGGIIDEKPRISSIKVDPLSPLLGAIQKISFSATSTLPIAQVASIIYTDNKKQPLSFHLVRGTTKNGEWEAQWHMDDTTNKTYKIIFHLVNKQDVRDDEIVFR